MTTVKDTNAEKQLTGWMAVLIWCLRLIVGAVFIVSGLAKAIDLWGVVFKFEEYFTAWNINVPDSLTVMGAMALSSLEFFLGCMMALGCFRRSVVWMLTAVMSVMLPLSLYVWLKDPVPDCGCFGDFLIISNGATFLKNIAIVALLVVLMKYNRKVSYLYHPYSQWVCGVACLFFVTMVELYGFNIQPMYDFRSFPEGTSLIVDDDVVDFEFVYAKNGEERVFYADSLPDSTWTFERRVPIGGAAESDAGKTELSVTDSEGEDVTADVISDSGMELLIVVPQAKRADMFYTAFTNDLNAMMNRMGGSLVELTDVAADSIAGMRDYYMAEFPVFHVESTVLKELSRGVVSVVLLKDGIIQWKRNMGSVDVESLVKSDAPEQALMALRPDGGRHLVQWAAVLATILVSLLLLDKLLVMLINRRKNGEAENKCVNLHDELEMHSAKDAGTSGNNQK